MRQAIIPAGANFGFCDGLVHFVKNSISSWTFEQGNQETRRRNDAIPDNTTFVSVAKAAPYTRSGEYLMNSLNNVPAQLGVYQQLSTPTVARLSAPTVTESWTPVPLTRSSNSRQTRLAGRGPTPGLLFLIHHSNGYVMHCGTGLCPWPRRHLWVWRAVGATAFPAPPHGGNIILLPDLRGVAEDKIENLESTKGSRTASIKSRIIAYFYAPTRHLH